MRGGGSARGSTQTRRFPWFGKRQEEPRHFHIEEVHECVDEEENPSAFPRLSLPESTSNLMALNHHEAELESSSDIVSGGDMLLRAGGGRLTHHLPTLTLMEHHPWMDELETKTINGVDFIIDKRYDLLEVIGQGAYGVVVAARDTRTGEEVAIKKCEKAFEHVLFTKRALRELRTLRHLRHENVVQVKEVSLSGPFATFNDIYIVCNLNETDLGAIIKSMQELSNEHHQFFLYQILRGIKYIHSAGIIHRDLKPRNILVDSNCDLRICDFGLARVVFQNVDSYPVEMTEYVSTRWYRAPEVLCSWKDYDEAVDVWSIGCIFAELLGRKPLFNGRDTRDQLRQVIAVVGKPNARQLGAIENAKCREFIKNLPDAAPVPLRDLFPDAPELALDLLEKTLKFDPTERITVVDALAHPYLQTLHCSDDEPVRHHIEPSEFAFECNPTPAVLRKEIWREMLHYHTQLLPLSQTPIDLDSPDTDITPYSFQYPTPYHHAGAHVTAHTTSSCVKDAHTIGSHPHAASVVGCGQGGFPSPSCRSLSEGGVSPPGGRAVLIKKEDVIMDNGTLDIELDVSTPPHQHVHTPSHPHPHPGSLPPFPTPHTHTHPSQPHHHHQAHSSGLRPSKCYASIVDQEPSSTSESSDLSGGLGGGGGGGKMVIDEQGAVDGTRRRKREGSLL
ncbi:unnamed protein product [Vitrella brassicaformis CCMP3155]|uniref:Mitogen-activated protein kinase n=1 Tax=Vitrella brassicaformis (strain CCMP3155) TaxID=1169540 RepID=A0A0G4GCQ0_VITBC|nr:unnamed protein product [Vitrella brassicaformis CCMP3155]|eukprot:CEM26923.1 unnamed protein product [Vitrella brassicaformis CCMP3155]